MPALEPLSGLRVVADPAALDSARFTGPRVNGARVAPLRLAPDEVFAIGATSVEVDDDDAIVVDEAGYVGGAVRLDDLLPHIEWSIPPERPILAQGSIAGVPAKLWLTDDGTVFLVVQAAYVADLADRLGWPR